MSRRLNMHMIFILVLLNNSYINAQTLSNNSEKDELDVANSVDESDSDSTLTDPLYLNATLSYSETKGNANNKNIEYTLKIGRSTDSNLIEINVEGANAKTDGELFLASYSSNIIHIYNLTKKSGWYEKVSFYKNEFRGYIQQWEFGAGYLTNWCDDEKYSLKTRIGYQARINNLTTEHKNEQNLGLLGYRAKIGLLKNITLNSELNYCADFKNFDNYFFDGFAALEFTTNEVFSIMLNYNIFYVNIPVAEKARLDTTFKTVLVINI